MASYIDEDGWKIPVDNKSSSGNDGDGDSPYKLIKTSLKLSIPPVFAQDSKAGAIELLDSLIMKYIPTLQSVFLTHLNVEFKSNVGLILDESPFSVTELEFAALVWSPSIGQRLKGRVTLCSPDHISLLVHHTFNVTIPKEFIDTNAFKYAHDSVNNGGRWVNKYSTQVLAQIDNVLEFTIIETNINNQMLTLTGSLIDINKNDNKKRRNSQLSDSKSKNDDRSHQKKAKIPVNKNANSSDSGSPSESDSSDDNSA